MSSIGLVDLQEQERRNTTLLVFTGLASWTPAMGALLVSGIDPGGRPRDIPVGNLGCVGNPGVAASEAQIHWAHKVFANWLDCQLENDGTSNIQASKVDMEPADFLIWCMDDYDDYPASMKPPWLDYILLMLGNNPQSGVPLPAPSSLVTRAAALEKLVPFIGAERTKTKSISRTMSPEDALYVEKMSACIDKGANPHSGISKLIIEALGRSENPRDWTKVWTQLCKMAESGDYEDLKFVSRGKFSVPTPDGPREIYDRSRLRQFLDRYKRKCMADLPVPGV